MKTTRLSLDKAIAAAKEYSSEYKTKNKLSVYCIKFLEKNEKVIDSHQKKKNRVQTTILREVELKRISLAQVAKKDSDENTIGEILYDKDGKYKYSKESLVQLTNYVDEMNDKLEEDIEDFLKQEVDVQTIGLISDGLSDVSTSILRGLRGFIIELKELECSSELEHDEQLYSNNIKSV